jgi:hypothetical protein
LFLLTYADLAETAAWVLSILNIAIEILGMVIPWYAKRKDNGSYQPISDPDVVNSEGLRKTTNGAMSDPLLVRYDALETMGNEVHTGTNEPTPETK